MKNVFRILLALALGAFGVWLWLALFPSPEKIITKRFGELAKAASIHAGEGYLPRLAGVQRVGGYFAASVVINIDIPGHQEHSTLSRDDLMQMVMAAQVTGGLTVKFSDLIVSVSADKENAQAEMTVEARPPGDPDPVVQQMKFTLQKTDGKWLITRVQTVRTFS